MPPAGGYDAVGHGRRAGRRIQIKGRANFDEALGGQRIGQLKTEQEWVSVMLVLMDENYEPAEIYEAECEDVMEAVDKASSNRSKLGAVFGDETLKTLASRVGAARTASRTVRFGTARPAGESFIDDSARDGAPH